MRIFDKIVNWYFSKSALPYWCILALDCIIVVAFFVFGYYCILGGEGVIHNFWPKLGTVCGLLVFYLLGFKIFHTYANVVRYSTFIDLRNVFLAGLLGSLCVLVLRVAFFPHPNIIYPGLRITLFAFCFSTMAMCAWRVVVKSAFDISTLNVGAKHIFIYGVQSGGVSLAKSIRNQKPSQFKVCGMVTPESSVEERYIVGVKVYANDINLVPTMLNLHIEGLMVSPLQSQNFRENDRLITDLTEAGIKIYMMPEAQEWDGKSDVSQTMLKEVDIEDLLPRETIEVDMEAISELLNGHRILITGAAGSIGSELVRQVALFQPSEMVLIDQAETPMHDIRLYMAKNHPELKVQTIVTSITNELRMGKIFADFRPEYVFHAAAYKHVPMMENNPSEAVQNNIYGTRVIADLAVRYGTQKFVMISTDKAVNPTNVMGCSKRICEIYVQALDTAIREGKVQGVTQFVTTRFGNVLGSNGSVIPLFKEQIKNGGPVTVTHPDIIRFFMLIPEACRLVLEAGTFGNGGEIFVFDMGKPVRIVDLAKRMIALSGAKDIEIQFTGLRDGEKLFEEVLSEAEKTVPTIHPKIKVAQVRKYPYDLVLSNEERLLAASYTEDDMGIVKIMKEIVPEFKSRHSKYEVLDE